MRVYKRRKTHWSTRHRLVEEEPVKLNSVPRAFLRTQPSVQGTNRPGAEVHNKQIPKPRRRQTKMERQPSRHRHGYDYRANRWVLPLPSEEVL